MITREKYLTQLKNYLGKPIIKVITGMRRVGKSSILLMLAEEIKNSGYDILHINMESLKFSFIKDYKDLYDYTLNYFTNSQQKKIVFIDEVQEINNWERAVSSFLADDFADIYITGSNANMLSSELATLLSGRYIEIPVYPLTFKEFKSFSQINDIDELFRTYIRYGGLPGIHLFNISDDTIFNYLSGILNTVLIKDVLTRNKIRDIAVFEKIVEYLFDNIGNITTSKSISDYFKSQKIKINPETVHNYLQFLEAAFLIHKVPRYDLKGKKILEFYDKIFIGDIGLRHGLIGYRDNDISGILENIVYLELRSRGYDVKVGTQNGLEIDFIAVNKEETIYFQISSYLTSEETMGREFGNLEKIQDNYKKIVLSLDKFAPSDRNGIKHYYLPDFLLNY